MLCRSHFASDEAFTAALRDWFAGQALAGWLSSYPGGAIHPAQHDGKPADLARHSYALADAMLRARAKAEG